MLGCTVPSKSLCTAIKSNLSRQFELASTNPFLKLIAYKNYVQKMVPGLEVGWPRPVYGHFNKTANDDLFIGIFLGQNFYILLERS